MKTMHELQGNAIIFYRCILFEIRGTMSVLYAVLDEYSWYARPALGYLTNCILNRDKSFFSGRYWMEVNYYSQDSSMEIVLASVCLVDTT